MSISIISVLTGCAVVTAATKVARGLVTAAGDVIRGDLKQAAATATGAIVSPVVDAAVGVLRVTQDVVATGVMLTERLRQIDEARDEARNEVRDAS